jgi:hypothetical protein
VVSPESLLHQQKPIGKVPMPALGLDQHPAAPNPFQGIRRAGQAKRAQNFEKWQNMKNGTPSDPSFQGAKNQSFGGLAGTQNGSMRQNKFQ